MRYTLTAEQELRCEIPESEPIVITLLNGNAEIFGMELVPNREYTFTDDNIAIFTWYGCVIEASGEKSTMYVADSTPMVAYVNTHMQLEARRDVALANGESGPRVLIAGPSDHGKSTTCRILSSYACRLDRTPIFIDLDVGQTSVMPGSVCAMPLHKFKLAGKGLNTLSSVLALYFGHTSPKDNVDLYKSMVTNLAEKVNLKLANDMDARSSGIFVNTTGFIDGEGFDVLKHCIEAFSIDIVLVMGHDRLYSSLSSSLPPNVALVKLPHSGGVVQRDRAYRSRQRRQKIWEYFYGSKALPSYSPARIDVKISSLCLLRAGGIQLSEGMRLLQSGGASSDSCQPIKINPSQDLHRCILAVLVPSANDATLAGDKLDKLPPSLLKSCVAGYVCVLNLEIEEDKMTLLSPSPGPLPSNFLLSGSVKWDA
jgi:polyribonucleotide 5'-hydroxyl-kinase